MSLRWLRRSQGRLRRPEAGPDASEAVGGAPGGSSETRQAPGGAPPTAERAEDAASLLARVRAVVSERDPELASAFFEAHRPDRERSLDALVAEASRRFPLLILIGMESAESQHAYNVVHGPGAWVVGTLDLERDLMMRRHLEHRDTAAPAALGEDARDGRVGGYL